MRFELLHPADQLVMIMNRIYYYGMTTTSGGNLSIRDDNGDIWITPSGIDKGNLTRADMCQVKPDGTVIGPHKPSVELPFHSEIYRRRPDLKGILHAHPPTLVAFSLARKIPDISLIPNASEVCGKVTYAKYEVPGSKKLGEYIAAEFEKGYNTVMMENHGVVIGHKDLFSAFMAFETLDFCGRLEIDAKKLGTPRNLTEEQIDIDRSITSPSLDEFIPGSHSSEENAARRDLCEFIHRSYDQRLFTSTQGTFAVRLSDGSFLTTPYNKDRKYLESEDIVHIKHGMREMGKKPSRATRLLEEIFDTHDDDQRRDHRPSAGHHVLRRDRRRVRFPPDPRELHQPAGRGARALRRQPPGHPRHREDLRQEAPRGDRQQPVRHRHRRVPAQRL